MIRNVKKTWKRFCRSPVLIRESYRHLQCLRPETKPLVNKISDQIIGLMDYISKVGMTNAVAPLCCGTRLMLDEVEAEINGVCLNMTGLLESGKFVRSIVSSTVTDMMELMCSAYSDTRTCSQKHPTIMSDIRNVIEHPKESNHQIVTSFLSLFKKLERESQTGF